MKKNAKTIVETNNTNNTTAIVATANNTTVVTPKAAKKEAANNTNKAQRELESCKREYDSSLASAVRFIAEVATGTLDSDSEICGRARAAKLYMWLNIADRNNAKGRKIILNILKNNAPYIDGGVICERKKLNKEVREQLGYVGARCIYCYKEAGWLTAIGLAYDNRLKKSKKSVVKLTTPNNNTPLSGTIENLKGIEISENEYKAIEKTWIEIKDAKK